MKKMVVMVLIMVLLVMMMMVVMVLTMMMKTWDTVRKGRKRGLPSSRRICWVWSSAANPGGDDDGYDDDDDGDDNDDENDNDNDDGDDDDDELYLPVMMMMNIILDLMMRMMMMVMVNEVNHHLRTHSLGGPEIWGQHKATAELNNEYFHHSPSLSSIDISNNNITDIWIYLIGGGATVVVVWDGSHCLPPESS